MGGPTCKMARPPPDELCATTSHIIRAAYAIDTTRQFTTKQNSRKVPHWVLKL